MSDDALAIAQSLASGRKVAVWLGNLAAQHARASELQMLAQEIARLTGGSFGFIGEPANSVGGYLAGAVPGEGGLNAAAMIEQPRKAYVTLNLEPELDLANPAAAMAALDGAQLVVALTSFDSPSLRQAADVMLPIAPFTETSGTFVNCEGRAQSFTAVAKPLGDVRPGWKVLRVLGNLLGSWIAYAIGYYGRLELLERHKILHVNPKHIAAADRWFERHGDATVFWCRMLPIIRTFISLPAGVARMPFWRFTLLTLLGCIPWVLGLGLIGKSVGSNWTEWQDKLHYFDYLVAAAIVGGGIYLLIRWRRGKGDGDASTGADEPATDAGAP